MLSLIEKQLVEKRWLKSMAKKNKEMKYVGLVLECNTCGFEHSLTYVKDINEVFLAFDSIRKDKGITEDIFFGKKFYMECHGCKNSEFKVYFIRNYKV